MAGERTATHASAGVQLARAAARLADAGVASPDVDARLLLSHALGAGRLAPDRDVSGAESAVFERLLTRRVAREPLQLITGGCGFRLLDLACEPGVFVPRPETEIVAGLAIDRVRSQMHPVVVEPCTGTGAIGLSIVTEVPDARVIATDRDPAAVRLAERNLARVRSGAAGVGGLAAGASMTVQRGDLLDPVDPGMAGKVDVLVANPPYLPAADRSSWGPEVAHHDPPTALIGGADGHEVVDRLLALAPAWLRPGGTIVVEIDARRGDDAVAVARAAGLTGVRVERDLTGADRALVAVMPSVGLADPGTSQ